MRKITGYKVITAWAVLAGVLFSLSGCADLERIKDQIGQILPKQKKAEEETEITRYVPVKTYDVHPSIELYTKRYIFWKNWHREILAVLRDENQKKARVAIEQEVGNLRDMERMLVDEKGERLREIIDEMSQIEAQIKKEKVTTGNEVRIRKKLEFLGKEIKRDYSYNKMRGFIRDDFKQRQSAGD